MGADYQAYVAVGIRFLGRDVALKQEARTEGPGCDHKFPTGAKFCPQCGAKQLVVDVESKELDLYDLPKDLMFPLSITWDTDSNNFYIGAVASSENSNGYGGKNPRLDMNVVDKVKRELPKFWERLRKHPDTKDFPFASRDFEMECMKTLGIHSVLHCSY